MNRAMIKIAAIAMLVACCATSGDAYAANPPRGKFGTQTAARKQENDDMKRKLAPYLTDEGMSGRVSWKEYAVNPKAKGEPTLLVVFGGRDSVRRGNVPGAIPPAIDKALVYGRTRAKDARLVVLVPEIVLEHGKGFRERPSTDGIAKLVLARAEANGVKRERIFATGFSMGGGLVYSLLDENPTLFSRAVVVGASGDPRFADGLKAEIFALHGADDDLIPLASVKSLADAASKKAPGKMKLEVLAKTGHAESEKAAYSKPAVWSWLFR